MKKIMVCMLLSTIFTYSEEKENSIDKKPVEFIEHKSIYHESAHGFEKFEVKVSKKEEKLLKETSKIIESRQSK